MAAHSVAWSLLSPMPTVCPQQQPLQYDHMPSEVHYDYRLRGWPEETLFIMWILQWIMYHNCFHSLHPKLRISFAFGHYFLGWVTFLSLKKPEAIFSQRMRETKCIYNLMVLKGLSVFKLKQKTDQRSQRFSQQTDQLCWTGKLDLSCQYLTWRALKTAQISL